MSEESKAQHYTIVRLQAVAAASDRPYAASVAREAADLITLQATTIAEQAGEIERLTEDRGSWRRVSERLGTEKAALVSRLKEALEPFAREAERFNETAPDYIPAFPAPDDDGSDSLSTLGDFRRAAALLSELGERGE